MKKFILLLSLSIVPLVCIIQCKKEPINIILYDKPLNVIQHYIQGKWRLVYGKGGICSTCVFPCDNCYFEYTSDNRFISKAYVITTDTTTVRWVRDIGMYLNGDSTYLMTFVDKYEVPSSYVIDQIFYDTLIYHDNSSDPMFYHCVRSK